jgi:hypothetical protein
MAASYPKDCNEKTRCSAAVVANYGDWRDDYGLYSNWRCAFSSIDQFDLGAELTWQFADSWSFKPEILYVYDDSNTLAYEYSSTEIWFTVRKDF